MKRRALLKLLLAPAVAAVAPVSAFHAFDGGSAFVTMPPYYYNGIEILNDFNCPTGQVFIISKQMRDAYIQLSGLHERENDTTFETYGGIVRSGTPLFRSTRV